MLSHLKSFLKPRRQRKQEQQRLPPEPTSPTPPNSQRRSLSTWRAQPNPQSNNKRNAHRSLNIIDCTKNFHPEPTDPSCKPPQAMPEATMKQAVEAPSLPAPAPARCVALPAIPKPRRSLHEGLEQYEIIQKLGDGAFSNVYKARDTTTGRLVAIKVAQKVQLAASNEVGQNHLHPNMKKKPRVTERANIIKEVEIMRSGVKHPNIVQLIEFTESKDHYFLTLELCEGGELFHQIVKLTYFSEDLARHVITQVAQAVHHLHETCGVVHRDIKPENILFDAIPVVPSSTKQSLDPNKVDEGVFMPGVGGGGIGQVKLADFGLSKVIWDNSTLTPCGTVGYTAPEIVRDQRYSKAVDMWAIGCVLYTILCGFPPFYDESITELTAKVARGQFAFLSPWWDPVSDAAKDLITHLLCVDPGKRYTIQQFLNHPWVTGAPFVETDLPNGALAERRRSSGIHYGYAASLGQERLSSTTINTISPSAFLDLETPDSTRRRDVFSPGVPTLKEILDITYAVQRMGEEKTWRGATLKGYRDNDEPVYEEEDDAEVQQRSLLGQREYAPPRKNGKTAMASVAAPHSPPVMNPKKRAGFELNMNNATLLNRRLHIQ